MSATCTYTKLAKYFRYRYLPTYLGLTICTSMSSISNNPVRVLRRSSNPSTGKVFHSVIIIGLSLFCLLIWASVQMAWLLFVTIHLLPTSLIYFRNNSRDLQWEGILVLMERFLQQSRARLAGRSELLQTTLYGSSLPRNFSWKWIHQEQNTRK